MRSLSSFILYHNSPGFATDGYFFIFIGYYLSRCGQLASRLAILYKDGQTVQDSSEFSVTLADMQGSADVLVIIWEHNTDN